MIPGLTLIEDQISFYNVRRSGTEYNSTTLLSAIEDLGSVECVAYLSKGMEDEVTIWTIDQNVTFPENISVLIPCGVMLQINAGITITFDGPCFNQCPNWYTGLGQIVLNSKTAVNSQSYKDFFNGFVVNGGIHGLSPTCYSPNFFTEAYVANGQYIREDTYSIRYGDLGANCAGDTVFVVISNFDTPTIPGTNFVNVPGTHYYIDFISTSLPLLPLDSAFLMEVILLNDQIVQVNDLRSLDAAQGLLDRVPVNSWTPELYPGTYTYTSVFGNYAKFGKLVYASGAIRIATVTTLGSGILTIRNLPYQHYMGNLGGFNMHFVNGLKPGAGPSSISGIIFTGEGHITLVENIIGAPSGYVTADRVRAGFDIYFSGTYPVLV